MVQYNIDHAEPIHRLSCRVTTPRTALTSSLIEGLHYFLHRTRGTGDQGFCTNAHPISDNARFLRGEQAYPGLWPVIDSHLVIKAAVALLDRDEPPKLLHMIAMDTR